MHRAFVVAFLLSLFVGCRPPPDAPETFDELTSYLILHFDDEEPEALQAGMTNMRAWLDEHKEEVSEGYRLTPITPNAVDAIPDPCPVEMEIGAGAAFEVGYPIDEVVEVALAHDPMEVYEGSFGFNERVYVEDLDCFLAHECEKTEYHSHIENQLPLGIVLEVWMITQIRWVELEDGPAVLYRLWMSQPAQSSMDWINVSQQYGMATTFSTETGVHKLEAGWIDMALGDIEVPEDLALTIVIDSIVDSGDKIQTYMDGLQ
jgi:hypothetical protein